MPRTIAILGGTGAEGFGLALRLARAGARIRIGSRDAARARAAAERLAHNAQGFVNAEAVEGANPVILAVPLEGQIPTLKAVRGRLAPGTVLIDATVPLEAAVGGRLSHLVGLWAGSAGQQAARYVPEGVHVVGAFHTLSAELLAQDGAPLDSDVLLVGDSTEAKAAAVELVAMLPGVRAIDAGPLENARLVESLAALLVSLNLRHKVRHCGVRITGLP